MDQAAGSLWVVVRGRLGQKLECVFLVPVSLILAVTECVYIHLSLLCIKDSDSWVPPSRSCFPSLGRSPMAGRVLTPPPFPAEGKDPGRP